MESLTKLLPILVAVLGAGWLFERSRRQSSEAVLKNQEELKKVDEIQKKKDKIDLNLELEFIKQSELAKKLEEVANEKTDDKSLVDFFNKSDS